MIRSLWSLARVVWRLTPAEIHERLMGEALEDARADARLWHGRAEQALREIDKAKRRTDSIVAQLEQMLGREVH